MEPSLYLGFPESFWSDLCQEIEDVFYEDKIGQIILGIYPSGNRLFGLEYYNVEVICLYINSSEDILNPLKNQQKIKIKKVNNTPIKFINFWDWISNFNKPIEDIDQLIPCFGKILYQEDSIAGIIDVIYEFLNNIDIYWSLNYYHILNSRLIYLFNKTKKFIPNLNINWGPVLPIKTDSQYISKLDSEIIESLVFDKKIPDYVYNEYNIFLEQERINFLREYNKTEETERAKSYLKRIGEISSKFYRSII